MTKRATSVPYSMEKEAWPSRGFLTCMAKAFRAMEIGPFLASQAAISETEMVTG